MSDYNEATRHLDAPPDLQVSQQPYRRCDLCTHFATIGRSHVELDGKCSAYEAFVRGDFLCESFLSIYQEPKQRLSYNGYSQPEPPGVEEPDDGSGQQSLV